MKQQRATARAEEKRKRFEGKEWQMAAHETKGVRARYPKSFNKKQRL